MANKKQAKIANVTSNEEIKKMGIILGVLILIIAIFYIGTYLMTKEPEKDKEATTIQYKEIIVGNLLSKKDAEYYVLATKGDDQFLSLYLSYFTIYNKKEETKPYYTINLDSNFNKKYFGDTSNFVFENIKDIKFSDATLLKIKDGKIVENYVGKENIVNILNNLIK